VPRRVVTSWTYEVPAPQNPGFARAVLGGWQWAGAFQAQDGFPFSVFDGIQRSFTSANTNRVDRPDLVPGRSKDSIILGSPDKYFDPTAFQLQAARTLGNTPQGYLRGPGLALLDTSVTKTMNVANKGSVQIKLEVFNLLNRANFSLPDNTLFQGTGTPRAATGRIRSTTTTAREFQLGFKFIF
jgi:hypothetical protein